MPIEIRELHIKVNVNNAQSSQKKSKDGAVDKEIIIAECVEQIMEMLKENKSR